MTKETFVKEMTRTLEKNKTKRDRELATLRYNLELIENGNTYVINTLQMTSARIESLQAEIDKDQRYLDLLSE